jgi:dephospho-CoA kinase
LVGLTGGIGSGKSTVSSQLEGLGAIVVDADAVVRELQEPGQPVFDAMVDRWGAKIVTDDGTLDRAAVARIVFSDPDELRALESIVHPVLRAELKRRITALSETDEVVILDMALIAEKDNPYGVDEIIVVDLAPAEQIRRLVAFRGFSADDAERRIAAQASRDQRLAIADHVIDNSGDLVALADQVNRLWETLTADVPERGSSS